MRICDDELEEFGFFTVDEAGTRLHASMVSRLNGALDARSNHSFSYLHAGQLFRR